MGNACYRDNDADNLDEDDAGKMEKKNSLII
jgi:hypothetical protein